MSHVRSSSLLNVVKTMPILSAEEEIVLVRKAKAGDQASLNSLILSYLRMGFGYIRKRPDAGIDDLIQEAAIGLIRGFESFDPDRGVRFGTYARSWMMEYQRQHIRNQTSIVRVPSNANNRKYAHLAHTIVKLERKMRKENRDFSQGELREMAIKEIGLPRETADLMQNHMHGDESLDATPGAIVEGTSSLQDSLVDEGANTLAACIAGNTSAFFQEALTEAMSTLTGRERAIIHARHVAEPTHTLEAIGCALGISKERVRQIEAKGLKKLRAALSVKKSHIIELLEAD